MNAVSDAFAQGNVIVVAGETHGQLNDTEEDQAWRSLGIQVYWENQPLAITGKGPITRMRLDSPFMRVVTCANDVCDDLLTPGQLAQWLSDPSPERQSQLPRLLGVIKSVVADALGDLRQELTDTGVNLSTSPKLKKAQVIAEYVNAAIDSIKVTSEKAGYLGGLTPVRAELANSAGLKHEITSAIALEDDALAQFSDRPRLARSACMALRLLSWGPHVTPKALWKVGEGHINDFDQLNAGAAHNVRVMHKAEYLPALRSAVSPQRSQQTLEFLQQQPLGPLMDYMVDKGWVRQPT
ncbi:MAG TPA: hypothetical protein VH478_23190 [Trebonia sp.]|jgi:hypothetical protein|nr:hypothetical protein [Trebonia sp.]